MQRAQITSRQNPRVKHAVALRQARARRMRRQFVIDGAREIARAQAAGVRLLEVFVCEPLCRSADSRAALDAVADSGATVYDVTDKVFEKMSYGNRAEGVLAVAETPAAELSDIELPPCPLVAVLEGVEKPGNVGAVLRSADAAGVSAVVIADGGTDLHNPNTIRASLGTVFSIPCCAAPADELRGWLSKNGMQIVVARPDAKLIYSEVDYTQPCAFVLGSEAAGVSSAWTGEDVVGVNIPMQGVADSLNLSVAAAVLFFEAWRQRNR